MLEWRVVAISVFAPRAPIISHLRIARGLERIVRVRRAIAALAVRNNFGLAIQAKLFELCAQLLGRFESASLVLTCGPIEMNRAGNSAGVFRADAFAVILL